MPTASQRLSKNPANRNYNAEAKEKAYQLWRQGKILDEIEAETGIPRGTVGSWAKRYGWKARMLGEAQSGIPIRPSVHEKNFGKLEEEARLAKMLELPDKDVLEEYKGKTRTELGQEYTRKMSQAAMRLPALIAKMSDAQLLDKADKIAKLDSIARDALGIKDAPAAPQVNINLVSGGGLPPPRVSKKAQVVELPPPAEALPESTDTE